MASNFWFLDDGRCFSRSTYLMMDMTKLICKHINSLNKKNPIISYINTITPSVKSIPNGYDEFYDMETNENTSLNFDLRKYSNDCRELFWTAVELSFKEIKLKSNNSKLNEMFTILLDMKNRIDNNEDPMKMNHLKKVLPYND